MERDEKMMMVNKRYWPQYPILPVKRRRKDKSPEVGVMTAWTGSTIFLVNMWSLPKTYKGFDNIERLQYEDIDGALADGWIVD